MTGRKQGLRKELSIAPGSDTDPATSTGCMVPMKQVKKVTDEKGSMGRATYRSHYTPMFKMGSIKLFIDTNILI